MALKSFDQFSAEIDQAVHTDGPLGKTTAGGLNTVLKSLASELVDQQSAMPDLSHKADLDSSGRVPSSQLPSYVDDIVEAASFAVLPTSGEAGKVYVTLDTNQQYRWAGSAYALLSDSGLTTDVKAALEAGQNPSASNAFVTQAAVASSSNRYADIVSLTRTRTYYDTITDVVVASQAGDTINLYAPIFAAPTQSAEAFIDLKPGVNINIYGVKLVSPDTGHDILTFRGGTSIVNGYHSTITQNPTAYGGGWFIGTYGGLPVDADATINDLNLELVTYNSVGFALYGNGTYRYRGNVTSAGRYVVKLAASQATTSFQGEGTIYQTGTGYIFWLFNGTSLSWRGDITARDSSTMLLEAGTVMLREGILHAQERTAGAEKVVTNTSADSTLILENYAVLGVAGKTVIEAGTVILRGNTVVIGNIEATILIDERPVTTQQLANVVHLSGNETIAGVKNFVGKVGIGTSTPDSTLHMHQNNSSAGLVDMLKMSMLGDSGLVDYFTFKLGATSQRGGSIVFGENGGGFGESGLQFDLNKTTMWQFGANPLVLRNDAVELVVAGSGNVGIGADTPSEKLDVAGNVKATAFIGDGSRLTGIATGGPSVTVEQNLSSNSTTSVPSVAATKTVTDSLNAQVIDIRKYAVIPFGPAGSSNYSQGPLDAGNTLTSHNANLRFGNTIQGNTFGTLTNCTFGDNITANTLGFGANNVIGSYFALNVFAAGWNNCTFAYGADSNSFEGGISYCNFGAFFSSNTLKFSVNNCRFGDSVSGNTVGLYSHHITLGDGCTGNNIGSNCSYVELYNCTNLTVPANTTKCVYRYNVLVTSGTTTGSASVVLYNATGQATDGALTQKASTNALATKADLVNGVVPVAQLPAPVVVLQDLVSNSTTSVLSVAGAKSIYDSTQTQIAYIRNSALIPIDDPANFNFSQGPFGGTLGVQSTHNIFGTDIRTTSVGEYASNNAFGSYITGLTIGEECFNNTFGSFLSSNKIGDVFNNNTVGTGFSSNTVDNAISYSMFGPSCRSNVINFGCAFLRFGTGCSNNNIGVNSKYISINDGSTYITIGSNCQYIEIYNCKNLSVPAGTIRAIYRDNVLISSGNASVPVALYSATGQATNGAMTQKATTNALGLKVDTVAGLQLSQESYTTAEKSKLSFNPYVVSSDICVELIGSNAQWKEAELVTASSTLYPQPYPAGSMPGMKFKNSNGTSAYVYEYMMSALDSTKYNWVRYVAG